MKADGTFDPTASFNALIAAAVAEASTQLNSKNTELLGQIRKLKDAAATLPEGFSAEKWKELVELEKTVDRSKLESNEAVESLRTQMTEAHAAEVAAFKANEKSLMDSLETQLIDNAVSQAIVASDGNSTLLLPHVKSHVKMVKDDATGEFRAVVVNPDGTPRYSMVKAGENMAIDELITSDFKTNDMYMSAFANGNTGGGGGGGGGGGKVINPFDKKSPHYSRTEQSKLMNKDPEQAKLLQAQAEGS